MSKWLLLIVVLITACSTGRNVNKSVVSLDSLSVLKTEEFSKSSAVELNERRSVSKSKGVVSTKPDSVVGNFFFNPLDTGVVETALETGTLRVKALFNPVTGKGILTAEKKAEEVTVDVYNEESIRMFASNTDSNSRRVLDSTVLEKKERGKVSDARGAGGILGGLLLVLCCIVLAIWVRKYCKQ
ncbi:hypothetical protein HNQ91_003934 [Filimonas zeae]|uniref:Lipoprotein n=1 Tax=Filimonas zeae TaxID=1737353 RepID=A0A917MYC1_9BACT|nr:hypothetical protein [Filimonas zeae]MDR6340861.1 hypothetical protein [Filimonas zeae]GGH78167.1 hypothetical protein GCM10011379_45640 [Filimonas zeae]